MPKAITLPSSRLCSNDADSGKLRVAAAKVSERFAVANYRVLDFADDDGVIAARIGVNDAAFNRPQHVAENRHASHAFRVACAAEAIRVARGKAAREDLLVFGQDVDREVAPFYQQIMNRSVFVYADKHQRRLKRQRRE